MIDKVERAGIGQFRLTVEPETGWKNQEDEDRFAAALQRFVTRQVDPNGPLVLRPFTKVDWYGLAGCTRFDDGAEPRLAEVTIPGWPEPPSETFVDGVCLLVVDGEGVYLQGDAEYLHLAVKQNRAVVERIAEMILAAPPSVAALKALGFEGL